MEATVARGAGLDVAKKSVVACVLAGEPGAVVAPAVRTFGTMTADLERLAGWLAERGVTHVAMEATGVYWKAVVRHEALLNREGMKGPLQRTVAAVR
jgi:hypothetical protein